MRKNYRYEIVENKFHGSRHIAYALSMETAVQSAHRHDTCTRRKCLCGGPGIRNADGSMLSEADYYKMRYLQAAAGYR